MSRWQRWAWTVWAVIAIVSVGRGFLSHLERHRGCYDVFRDGGISWLAGQPLYDNDHPNSLNAFRYSPPVAVLCAPLAWMSDSVGSATLRLVNVGVLLLGLCWWASSTWARENPNQQAQWMLLTALAGGSALLDVQLNMLMLGCLLVGMVALAQERWTLSALAISIAVLLKAYPLSLALVCIALYPRRFGPRFVLCMASLMLLPFVLQTRGYVIEQYRDWIQCGLNARYLEGWFQDVMSLWQCWLGPMERKTFTAMSVVAGAAVGLVVLWRRPRIAKQDLEVSALGMCLAWMMAFGPATEPTTYVVLAPAAALAALATWRGLVGGWRRPLGLVAYALLALSQLQLLFPLNKPMHRIGAQPIAALLLLLVYASWKTTSRHSPSVSSTDRDSDSIGVADRRLLVESGI